MTEKINSINLQFDNYDQEGLYLHFEDSSNLILTNEVIEQTVEKFWQDPIKIPPEIINADDFGLCASVNKAIAKAHKEGVLTSATIMANMPAAKGAVRIAKKLPDLGVGVHEHSLATAICTTLAEIAPVAKKAPRCGRWQDLPTGTAEASPYTSRRVPYRWMCTRRTQPVWTASPVRSSTRSSTKCATTTSDES